MFNLTIHSRNICQMMFRQNNTPRRAVLFFTLLALATAFATGPTARAGPLSSIQQFAQRTAAQAGQAASATVGGATSLYVSPIAVGRFHSVQAAIQAVPANNTHRITIHIAPGTYRGQVMIPASKPYITLRGTNAKTTTITDNLPYSAKGKNGVGTGYGDTATVCIFAPHTRASGLSFVNNFVRKSNHPGNQATAVNIHADRVSLVRCRITAYQDTLLFSQAGARSFLSHCRIAGAVDFIYGKGTALLSHCHVVLVNHGRWGCVTAPATPRSQRYGLVFWHCRVTGRKYVPKKSVWLGRPWHPYGSAIYIDCYLGPEIRPVGWLNWKHAHDYKTARLDEFHSTGPGANPAQRVPWSHQLTAAQAGKITVESVLAGHDGWRPQGRAR